MSTAPPVGKYAIAAVVGYGFSTFFSYKYNQFTKAQSDLKDVKDQRKFLHNIHQRIAEKYDETYQKREFSNKLSKYRRIVLSYAEGKTLEVGIGTGENLKYYNNKVEVRRVFRFYKQFRVLQGSTGPTIC